MIDPYLRDPVVFCDDDNSIPDLILLETDSLGFGGSGISGGYSVIGARQGSGTGDGTDTGLFDGSGSGSGIGSGFGKIDGDGYGEWSRDQW